MVRQMWTCWLQTGYPWDSCPFHQHEHLHPSARQFPFLKTFFGKVTALLHLYLLPLQYPFHKAYNTLGIMNLSHLLWMKLASLPMFFFLESSNYYEIENGYLFLKGLSLKLLQESISVIWIYLKYPGNCQLKWSNLSLTVFFPFC